MLRQGQIEEFIEEDAPYGDVTSRATVTGEAEAEIVAREPGVVAGLEEAGEVFEHLGIEFQSLAEDGGSVEAGETVAEASGEAYDLLLGERPALNLLMRMSGIATATRSCVHEVDGECRIAATRKTAPGLRNLDKRAVELGGGDPHRLNLSHAYLVKENHAAAAGGLTEAVEGVKEEASFTQKVEVEVETTREAVDVARMGVDALLLDNFSVTEVGDCIEKLSGEVDDLPLLEVSGGVEPKDLDDYAPLVDVVSMGWLTHSAPALDLSMRVLSE